jgi:outer membrane protein assembly factor BamE
VLAASGCLYKTPVQQGNILLKDDVEEVKTGMSKRQVALILGTPAIADPFHQDRWDYVNTSKIKGKFLPVKRLTIYFENDRVSRIEDNYFDHKAENPETTGTGSK